jgi:putative flippase GtrA
MSGVLFKGESGRYLLVGALAFSIDICTLFLLTHFLNIYYLYSAVIGFIAGLLFNYYFSITWVFTDRFFINRSHLEFFFFSLIGIGGLLLNEALLWILVSFFFVQYLVAKVVTVVVVFMWNFFIRKWLLFSKT